ncbi:hypothetical protein GCM10009548_02450 [Streptomyces malaysiensis subsp. malaysiensis]|uniref:Uncharacterized protein n=1 Tax=Streptomyces malaysiensis TaxID=92644 RepID=A0ABX6W473_STRMQ|nr:MULTISPECIES: hypothetical protein [Streptomyces]QPI56298.1 hypothetical protein I1A49_16340 [Streptomyces solisilvae]UHH17782.1 hypothetical protein LUV23_16460 [Streptomyces sp. HNM0561]
MTHSATYADDRERGTFGVLLQARRERKQREERDRRAARLVELGRSIRALEAWHHAWRLKYDEGCRALHPGEWCTVCDRQVTRNVDHWRCRTQVERREQSRRASAKAERQAASVTPEERVRATRRMAEWGSGA